MDNIHHNSRRDFDGTPVTHTRYIGPVFRVTIMSIFFIQNLLEPDIELFWHPNTGNQYLRSMNGHNARFFTPRPDGENPRPMQQSPDSNVNPNRNKFQTDYRPDTQTHSNYLYNTNDPVPNVHYCGTVSTPATHSFLPSMYGSVDVVPGFVARPMWNSASPNNSTPTMPRGLQHKPHTKYSYGCQC